MYLVYYSEMDTGSSLLPLETDMETAEEYEHTIATNIAQLGIVIYEVSTALDVTSGTVTVSMVEHYGPDGVLCPAPRIYGLGLELKSAGRADSGIQVACGRHWRTRLKPSD